MDKLSTLVVLSLTIVCITSIYLDDELGEHCGDKIPKIVSMVCNGLYFDPKLKKPSWEILDHQILEKIPEYDEYLRVQRKYITEKKHNPRKMADIKYPLQNRLNAFMIIQGRVKRDSGIVDECCKKACTINEIKTYCG